MRLNHTALTVIRERSGLSKSELADAAGVRRDTMTRLESGERGGTENQIRALAAALKVPVVAIIQSDRRAS